MTEYIKVKCFTGVPTQEDDCIDASATIDDGKHCYYGCGTGRGNIRAVAFALRDLADDLLSRNPPEFHDET